jgi:hypothetical protein
VTCSLAENIFRNSSKNFLFNFKLKNKLKPSGIYVNKIERRTTILPAGVWFNRLRKNGPKKNDSF